MLLSKQIADLASQLRREAGGRPYIRALIPTVADDEHFWTMIVELLEIVVHRDDFVLVERHRVKGEPDAQLNGKLT